MLHTAGRDPVTWSFAKLFARHVSLELREFEGVPGSHAWCWRRDGGLWRARLVTKAQIVGVVVAVVERAERVEFLVDDGTALVKAGKLNVGWNANDGARPEREIRVTHISRVEDPNEELLHWVHVVELAEEVYSADAATLTTSADASAAAPHRMRQWDQIAAVAFFELAVDAQTKSSFLTRVNVEPHDELLLQMLEALVHEQNQHRHAGDRGEQPDSSPSSSDAPDPLAVRVTFIDTLKRISLSSRAFAALRSSGLLFLEDTDADRHVLVSFEFSFKPALLRHLRDHRERDGQSIAELTEWTVTQRRFQRLPLGWLEISLQRLLRSGLVTQHEASQRFHAAPRS
ncbi:hypothetical protein PybrP1_008396 [[Pythium] brassicae (nom. inval.)]|nr:hypothetical protein PybrP1_008396 [[Pythium] brassicae (nom. inval.)]